MKSSFNKTIVNKAALVLCVFMMISARTWSQDRELKVITFNIRYDNPSDGVNRWDNRKEMIVGFLSRESPDIIGLQEVLAHISANLPGYAYTGVGRDDGKAGGEFSPVFYNKVRFKSVDSGTFWLSPSPGDTASVGWDAALTRICTWALLLDTHADDTILALNTHFDHVGEKARQESARLIKSYISDQTGWSSVLLTGDFNCTPDELPYATLTRGENQLADACGDAVGAGGETPGTYNGFGHAGGEERIDMIFIRGNWKTTSCEVKKVRDGAVYISDHFPVVAVLTGN